MAKTKKSIVKGAVKNASHMMTPSEMESRKETMMEGGKEEPVTSKYKNLSKKK